MNPRHVLGILAAMLVLTGGGPASIPLWLVVTGWMLSRASV